MTKAKILCELYHQFRLLNVDVEPEQRMNTGERELVEVDLAVYAEGKFCLALIVKRSLQKRTKEREGNRVRRWATTRRGERYQGLGVPVWFVSIDQDATVDALRVEAEALAKEFHL
jgi:hypothetical protein